MKRRHLMTFLAGLFFILSAIIGCGPSLAQVERENRVARDKLIADHEIRCEKWSKDREDLRWEADFIKQDDDAFHRGLSNEQVDKILLCEKYNNNESCRAYHLSLRPDQKETVREIRARKERWLSRYDASQRWGRMLAEHEREIQDLLAQDRANRAAMAQMIGAWGISNQLMLMNNTLNSMQGTMQFNRLMR
jgi:hypothetical protein